MSTKQALLLSCSLVVVVSCAALRPAPDRDDPRVERRGDVTSHLRTAIVAQAQGLLNVPYKYGGNRPNEGFDCSGLVVYLYQNAGLDYLPRTSRTQAKMGYRIDRQDARPGDLVFFKRKGGPVFHVSVVVQATPTELWVVHSTSSRGVIREDVLANSYWRPKISEVRNVLR